MDKKWFDKLQHIDSRIMYLLLVVAIIIPLIWKLDLPIVVSPAAQGAYDVVEKMPSDKIAIISINWDSGTIAENQPQTDALIRHMFMRNKKFAILAFAPQGSAFAFDAAETIGKEYGKEYGKDWVHFGYRPVSNFILIVQGLGRSIPKAIGTDIKGNKLSEIPMMKGIKDIHDVGLVAEITPANTLPVWIAFIHGPYRTPLWYATTSVGAPEAFNYLDAGQIDGMLTGMKGAAEYEHLIGRADLATIGSGALSTSQILIILLIIVGNIGYLSSKRRRSGS